MWHNHPFSQRIMTLKGALRMKVGGNGEEGLKKN